MNCECSDFDDSYSVSHTYTSHRYLIGNLLPMKNPEKVAGRRLFLINELSEAAGSLLQELVLMEFSAFGPAE